jgi:hypothetical protein
MGRVAKRVEDKRLLKVIRAFLDAGVMENGLVGPTDEGTPQGGPLSPPTKVQNSLLASCDGKRGEANAVGHTDLLRFDLHARDERADDLAPREPIGVVETFANVRCKFVEAA